MLTRTSRAATNIFSSEPVQMKTCLQIGARTRGSVPFFLNALFFPWASSAVHEFRQGRASDMKEKCIVATKSLSGPDRSRARGRRVSDRDSNNLTLLFPCHHGGHRRAFERYTFDDHLSFN